MIHMTRTLHDALYLSIAPFKLEESVLQVTRDFKVRDAGCFSEKDKATITAIIDRFEQGGTKAFEAKIAQVGAKVVSEITGRTRVARRGSLSMLWPSRNQVAAAAPGEGRVAGESLVA